MTYHTLIALLLSGTLASGLQAQLATSTNSLENAAAREVTRRQEDRVIGQAALREGQKALAQGDVKGAYDAYKNAVDLLADGPKSRRLHATALARFSSTSVRYAEYLVSRGEYAQAASVAREVLEPRYNPDYKPAALFLSRLEQPDYFNKTVTPDFAEERDEVATLLTEANGYIDSAQYDMAMKRYHQVLVIDKYNTAAFRGMEQVELGKQRYYDSAYNETRSRMLWQVDQAWERPQRRFTEARTSDSSALSDDRRGTERMVARLNRIIIPKLDLRDATVRQAINLLQQRSRELDTTEDDPSKRGINIVLKLPMAATAPLDEFGEVGVNASTGAERINLNLTNVPLYEALRYVATLSGLKVKVEPFAVSIVPLSEPTDTLEQRNFKVPPGFIAGTNSTGDDEAQAGDSSNTSGGGLASRQNAKDFLASQGVQFPPGASANFNAGSSRLVVRNTAPNLDLIESLVDAAMGEQPTQVEIESKFVEVSQNNLKELGFDWRIGPFAIGSGVYGAGGSPGGDSSSYPFVNPGNGQIVGADSVTSGLRTGSGTGKNAALSINSLSSLLSQNLGLGAGGAAPGILSMAGIFNNVQFQAVIRALNQQKGVDLMAAPKVTTKSGQKATISITRIFPYPTEFDPPEIPQSTGGTQSTTVQVGPGAPAVTSDPIVTPSFPTNFENRNLGVTLEVEPQIGPDGYTIDLTLSPEVVDFEGFINYGTPIYAPVNNRIPLLGPQRQLLTDNTINQPIFSTRKVTTNVSIWDGQTVALGGLIREDVQKVNDKVPILGDIPFAGALFRSSVDQKIKRNLIIFVTARLMDAAGQPLRPEDDMDQEEIVQPLGLPDDLPQPNLSAKGFRQK